VTGDRRAASDVLDAAPGPWSEAPDDVTARIEPWSRDALTIYPRSVDLREVSALSRGPARGTAADAEPEEELVSWFG
jgi:hypothetical protein